MRGTGAVGLVASSLLGVVPTPVAPASAGTPPDGHITAYMKPVHTTSSTGRHLDLWLQAEHGAMDVFLGRGRVTSGHEVHDWTFTPPQTPVFRFDRTRGVGHIDVTLQSTAGFAAVHLNLHQTGPWTGESCTSGSAAESTIAVTGMVIFRTHTHGRRPWGNIATTAHPMQVDAKGTVRAFDNCIAPQKTPRECRGGFTWQHGHFFSQAETGGNGRSVLEGSRWRQDLAQRGHVQRLDLLTVLAPDKRLVVHPDGSARLFLTAADGTRSSGHASLLSTGPADKGTFGSCRVSEWRPATWRNGKRPLMLHPDVGRDLTVNDGTGGFFERARPV